MQLTTRAYARAPLSTADKDVEVAEALTLFERMEVLHMQSLTRLFCIIGAPCTCHIVHNAQLPLESCCVLPTDSACRMGCMQSAGVIPDDMAYATLVDVYAKHGDWHGADKVRCCAQALVPSSEG